MGRPQTAICPEGGNFGLYMTGLLSDEDTAIATLRQVAAALPSLTSDWARRLDEATLVSAIGFGAAVWRPLFGERKPAELAPFEAIADGPRIAPATPADFFLHIHSARHDANFALARDVRHRLGGAVRRVEEVHGCRNAGGRDLTGFVDGTENPKGEERAEVALVGDEDPVFAGGSYVSVQRYVHDLARWQRLALAEQEATIGRTKAGDEELADDVKPPTAHIARVVIEDEGRELQVLRHSLPYGNTAECGLYFVAYGRSPAPFRRMLERMVRADEAGHFDRLLDYTRAVSGASFFVPSVDILSAVR